MGNYCFPRTKTIHYLSTDGATGWQQIPGEHQPGRIWGRGLYTALTGLNNLPIRPQKQKGVPTARLEKISKKQKRALQRRKIRFKRLLTKDGQFTIQTRK